MTPAELRTLLDNIVAEVDGVASFAGAVDPALIPAIAVGRAVLKQIPSIAEAVDNWISGNPPTQTELDDLQAKLKVLGDPDLP